MKNGTVIRWSMLLSLILLIAGVGTVSAYSFDFITPDEQTAFIKQGVGTPIVVECYSDNIKPGATIQITLSGGPSINQVATRSMVIQADGKFGATFDTWDLKSGIYTVTVVEPKDYPFGSKRNWFSVQIVDRTGELSNFAPRIQESSTLLEVSGKASETGGRGVELTVYKGPVGDGNIISGPTWVGTDDNGQFFEEIKISGYGTYQVSVADKDGYIGVLTYTVRASEGTTPTVTQTQVSSVSESSSASKTKPAYFSVVTGSGTTDVTVYRGTDWIIDYSLDGATPVRVDKADESGEERFSVNGNGKTLNMMIYPADESLATVRVSCSNAISIKLDESLAGQFGKPGEDPASTSTPMGAVLPFIGVLVAVCVFLRR